MPTQTFCMILIPLAATAQLLHANVWEYMLFGSLWSAWLCLIHSEIHHPWDGVFSKLGLGTAADHHVHHRTFIYNYGHTMMWWDRLAGTYRSPSQIRAFNKSLATEVLGGSNYTAASSAETDSDGEVRGEAITQEKHSQKDD